MSTPIEYASFLVRLWREAGPNGCEHIIDWQSEVEHIQTGRRWKFHTVDELLSFLRRQTDEPEGWQASIRE